MYLPGQLPSGYRPPNGSFTAATGGFFNSEPAEGTGAAEASSGGSDDATDGIVSSILAGAFPGMSPLGYPAPGSAAAPVAKPGYGDWAPGSPATLAALDEPGIEVREHFTFNNEVAERGACATGEAPRVTPGPAVAPSSCKWLLGAAALLTVISLSGDDRRRGVA